MMSRTRAALALFAIAVLGTAAALAAGCSPHGAFKPNLPPTTRLFVSGPVDTVNHVVHLYWFGSDVDGNVVYFEYRMLNPAQQPLDTTWKRTTATDGTFTVFTGDSLIVHPVFEIRAVDNDSLRDPHPARQDFAFTNRPPTVSLLLQPSPYDTTFASVTLTWKGFDIDGDITKAYYLVWLDGNEANKHVVNGLSYTVHTADFVQGGQLRSGYRTVFIQPVDDGGMAGVVTSVRWFVRAPVTGTRARLLIIDDIPSTSADAARGRTDSLYANTAARNVPADQYTILRLRPPSGAIPPPFSAPPFHSALDVEQTFKLFEAVVWYRGQSTASFPSQIARYVDGVGPYLDSGGNLYIEALDMCSGKNAPGFLNAAFQSEYLKTDQLQSWFDATGFNDSTAAWSAATGKVWYSQGATADLNDSLGTLGSPNRGVRAFGVRDTSVVAFWAYPGALNPANPAAYPVALLVKQAVGNKLFVTTMPMSLSNRFGNAARVLAKVFQRLGIIGP